MHIRGILYMLCLACCFSLPVTISAAEPTYQVTEQELTELSTIFAKLDSKQKQQQDLLAKQEKQLKMLQEQLKTSKEEISNSQRSVETLKSSLDEANRSLQESAAEAKRKNDRLRRQRDTWAAFAVIAVGAAIAHR